jgi:hypothetical protein
MSCFSSSVNTPSMTLTLTSGIFLFLSSVDRAGEPSSPPV